MGVRAAEQGLISTAITERGNNGSWRNPNDLTGVTGAPRLSYATAAAGPALVCAGDPRDELMEEDLFQ